MTVSVIIPSYNRKALTTRAVKSVLAQTYRDLEVLVIDDASRPEEVFLAESIQDPRVRVVRHEINQGLGAARNTGVREARGSVVAGLDSDDYWFPTKLAGQMAIYERQPDSANCLVYSSYYWEEDGKWFPFPTDFLREGEAMSDYLFIRQGDIHGSCWLGSRSLFERFPSAPELKRHQDWDMLLRMEAGQVRFVYCATPSGVRTCDLRGDRLSTAPVRAMRDLFLKHNIDRMTARSVVMWEALQLSSELKDSADLPWPLVFLRRQFVHLRHILTTPRIALGSKPKLLFDYIDSRLRNSLIDQLYSKPPETAEEVEAGLSTSLVQNKGQNDGPICRPTLQR